MRIAPLFQAVRSCFAGVEMFAGRGLATDDQDYREPKTVAIVSHLHAEHLLIEEPRLRAR